MKNMIKKSFRLLLVLTILIAVMTSCNVKNQNTAGKTGTDSTGLQQGSLDSTKVAVITQRFSNGVIKAEIAVKGNKRDGLTKNYHEDASLMSEINYVNNTKQGISRDYYPKKKVRMEIMYDNGLMNGDAKWYYESGEVYRVTPYIKGKAEGIQKEYYKDGKIKAEVPYKSGNAIPGLKEYSLKGELLKQPAIIIEKQDKIASEGKLILKLHMSDNSRKVKWYDGELTDWSLFPKSLNVIGSDVYGIGTKTYSIAPGRMIKKSLSIYAVITTEWGNALVIKKKYDL